MTIQLTTHPVKIDTKLITFTVDPLQLTWKITKIIARLAFIIYLWPIAIPYYTIKYLVYKPFVSAYKAAKAAAQNAPAQVQQYNQPGFSLFSPEYRLQNEQRKYYELQNKRESYRRAGMNPDYATVN